METHSSILAWEIPWTEEPGRLQSMGSHRGQYNLVTTQHPQLDGVPAYSVISGSLQPHVLQPARPLCPQNFSGKNTGVGCHFLLWGKNINNLRYADNSNPVAESEEKLKSLLMKVKEKSENAGLKLNIQKLTSWHLVPSLESKQMGKQWKQCQTLF